MLAHPAQIDGRTQIEKWADRIRVEARSARIIAAADGLRIRVHPYAADHTVIGSLQQV